MQTISTLYLQTSKFVCQFPCTKRPRNVNTTDCFSLCD
uniref:Uncharacterized protein n=1 Tax=Setaria italica TaxID=4555 RepID=K3YF82_SETIT